MTFAEALIYLLNGKSIRARSWHYTTSIHIYKGQVIFTGTDHTWEPTEKEFRGEWEIWE